MDSFMTTFARTYGPRTSGVGRVDLQAIIFSFSSSATDGMDGRKVQNIKTHVGDIGKACDAIAKSSGRGGIFSARAGEHFIPGTAARFFAIHRNSQFAFVGENLGAIRI